MKKTAGIVCGMMLALSLSACTQAGNISEAGGAAETVASISAAATDSVYRNSPEDDNRKKSDGEAAIEASDGQTRDDITYPETTEPETTEPETTGIPETGNDGESPGDEIAVLASAPEAEETLPQATEPVATQASTQTPSAPKQEKDGVSSFMANHGKAYLIISIIVMLVMAAAIAFLVLKRKSAARQVPPDKMDYPKTEEGFDSAVPSAAQFLPVKAVSVHDIGKRKNQEDSFGVSEIKDSVLFREKGVMAVVADGMGGLSGGENVSSMAVLCMLQGFSDLHAAQTGEEELTRLLNATVREVNQYLAGTVGLKKSGSTLMAVIIRDNMLSWISVGDSRTALFRNGNLTDLNRRHTYGEELDELARQNKISAAQANGNPDREKLTSYIGMGELKYVDKSARPMPLKRGDKVILMSDGVFNTLSDDEIEQILSLPSDSIGKTLNSRIQQKANPHQDNYTAVVLEILE